MNLLSADKVKNQIFPFPRNWNTEFQSSVKSTKLTGPETVPDPNKSPGLMLHPPTA